jgi:hypothetical protein
MNSSAPRRKNDSATARRVVRVHWRLAFGVLISAAAMANAAAPEPTPPLPENTLCAADEKAYFNCALHRNGKLVSLCGSPDLHSADTHLRYRFGRKDAIELEAPDAALGNSMAFFRSGGYSRSKVTQWSVGFSRDHYRYELFDNRDSEAQPAVSESGVRVIRDDGVGHAVGKVTTFRCAQRAFSQLSKLHSVLKCDEQLTFGGCKPE